MGLILHIAHESNLGEEGDIFYLYCVLWITCPVPGVLWWWIDGLRMARDLALPSLLVLDSTINVTSIVAISSFPCEGAHDVSSKHASGQFEPVRVVAVLFGTDTTGDVSPSDRRCAITAQGKRC